MSRPELTYHDLVDQPNSPSPDQDMLSALPQIDEEEENAPRTIIIGAISGPVLTQHQYQLEQIFPGLSFPHATQTRFVITYSEADPYPRINRWSLTQHGEFDDLPQLPPTPAELQAKLEELGIIDSSITLISPTQVRTSRKKKGGASTKVHQSRK